MRAVQFENLNDHAAGVAKAMVDGLPSIVWQLPSPNRPWILASTLALITRRTTARESGNYVEEKRLHKEIRASVRRDRAGWLNDQLVGGNWTGVRRLVKKPPIRVLQLQIVAGDLVGGEEKSDTFAEYLEKVQWEKLYANLQPSSTNKLGPVFDTCEHNFTEAELREALKGLSLGKAPGIDKIPPDLWNFLLQSDEAILELLKLCKTCWALKQVPNL